MNSARNRESIAETTGPLSGIRVIDASTVLAGPLIAALLGDFGADVVKIEHPKGDPMREWGPRKDGKPLWWKVVSRNKRCITLDLKQPHGAAVFRKLVTRTDVLIENFRTGTLDTWGVGPRALSELNPRLITVSVTGFGQSGPYARRPGFGTLAEAFSGFAHVTGEPDGPPTLPPIGLADSLAAYYGTFATMFALYERDANGTGSGRGQRIDVSLYEPLFATLGGMVTLHSELGVVPTRIGNRSNNSVPRNTYRTRDGRWVAVASSAPSIVKRILTLTGGAQFAADPRFDSAQARLQHVEEIDGTVAAWIANHDLEQVISAFEAVEAAVAPVYDIEQIMRDPQYRARRDIIQVPDVDFEHVRMPNAFPFLSRTPGRVRFAGLPLGYNNREILVDELQLSADELNGLQAEGVSLTPDEPAAARQTITDL